MQLSPSLIKAKTPPNASLHLAAFWCVDLLLILFLIVPLNFIVLLLKREWPPIWRPFFFWEDLRLSARKLF
jgi:hypothetical protein